MTPLPPTITLARLYAAQGYWRVALDIYRDLVALKPGSKEVERELKEIEKRLASRGAPDRKELRLLLRQCAELIKQERRRRQRSLGCDRG